jgi:hypothetical protein
VSYEMEIHVTDYAQIQGGEETGTPWELYEKDEQAFDTFVARLMELFRINTNIPPESGSFTIEVEGNGGNTDREIIRRDFHAFGEDADGSPLAGLYTVLSFKIRTCNEPAALTA